MEVRNSRIKNRIDGVMLLLLFFVCLLFALFLYLMQIHQRNDEYYRYKKTVEKLHSYNQQLDNTFIRSYRYLNNDNITHTLKMFEVALEDLKTNTLTQVFGIEIEGVLSEIAEKYKHKTELIETFKTLNSRITASVYYLHELNQQIKMNGILPEEKEKILSNVLFRIREIFIGTNLNLSPIEKDLKAIESYQKTDEDVSFFYRHVEQFLQDTRLMHKTLHEKNSLHLDESIKHFNTLLEHEYLVGRKEADRITLIFFTFAFIILIILMDTYLRVRRKQDEVNYLAYHDTLTHLPNRTEFERYMTDVIENEKKGLEAFFLLFIDLDRFKGINDTLGHDVGDTMLVVLANRIGEVLGEGNFLARIGGDEFVALIENKHETNSLEVLVEKVAEVIRKPIQTREYSLNTSASIGIAQYPKDGRDKSTLLRHADAAMYHAKAKGKDTYAYYNEQLSIKIQRRHALEQELARALKKKEFYLCYQPQYSLDTRQINGVEALVRWDSAHLGSVSPEEFIAVAEDTGLIVDLGYYIFEEACKQHVYWQKQGVEIGLIAINISSVQLRQIDAFEAFKRIIEKTGIDAKHIEIELTERFMIEYSAENLTILDDFRQLGCRISIDDFGTGYSSMSYLRSLSIDTIKIDKSFIEHLLENKHDFEVSKAIIALSQSLGYQVIAEGIEAEEQEALLRAHHCDMGQGYYFAKPMSGDALISFYHQKHH